MPNVESRPLKPSISESFRRFLANAVFAGIGLLVLLTGLHRTPIPQDASDQRLSWRVPVMEANSAELQLLPGIGPVLADRIISWRAAGGFLRRVENLGDIDGIGPHTINGLRSLVSGAVFSKPGEFKNED